VKEHDISTNKEHVDKHDDEDEVASAEEDKEEQVDTGPVDIFAK